MRLDLNPFMHWMVNLIYTFYMFVQFQSKHHITIKVNFSITILCIHKHKNLSIYWKKVSNKKMCKCFLQTVIERNDISIDSNITSYCSSNMQGTCLLPNIHKNISQNFLYAHIRKKKLLLNKTMHQTIHFAQYRNG